MLMVTRADIIAEARSWTGTPWRHQGRLKGIATDCVGFAIMVPVALGLMPAEAALITRYSRHPDPELLKKYLREYCDLTDRLIGGNLLLLCRRRNIPQHVAILTSSSSMIHAIDERRGVREHGLDQRWRSAIAGIYSYRGISEG
jgi:hypothetical protein